MAEKQKADDVEEPVAVDVVVDNVVTLAGREFHIEEPTVQITLRLLNVIGGLGVKGERLAAIQLNRDPSARGVVFGMLAGMSLNDLTRFGSAVLQFEDERDGQKWLKGLGNQLKIAPLIKAFFINWSKSEDLQESLRNFTSGVATLSAALRRFGLSGADGGE